MTKGSHDCSEKSEICALKYRKSSLCLSMWSMRGQKIRIMSMRGPLNNVKERTENQKIRIMSRRGQKSRIMSMRGQKNQPYEHGM
jgi:hypothetical protein